MQNLSTLNSIASGAGALGQVAQGVAGYRAGQANAAVSRFNAQQSLIQGAQEQASSNAKYRAAIGQQLVAQGASGLQMGTGSMLDAINQSRINQTFAAMQISSQAQSRANAYETQASIASSGATAKLLSGLMTGTSSFLSKKTDYANAGAAYGYSTDPTDPSGALKITKNAMNSINMLDSDSEGGLW